MMLVIWIVLESFYYNIVERIRMVMFWESVLWVCIVVF